MLNEDQINKIRVVLTGDGWNDVMKPKIADRARTAIKALTLSRSERATSYAKTVFDTDDDVLRAMIREDEWMVTAWENELLVHDRNARLDELDRGRDGTPSTANP